jgi:hypothetical protein
MEIVCCQDDGIEDGLDGFINGPREQCQQPYLLALTGDSGVIGTEALRSQERLRLKMILALIVAAMMRPGYADLVCNLSGVESV